MPGLAYRNCDGDFAGDYPAVPRWLTILPLGGDTARAVGMALRRRELRCCC